ncbi:Ribosomal RNA small subunit methyltransferase D [Candidatus Hepatoplasma crinochetorum Av]|uniref:Ribosomal RNA small subunit methyltransferase D n=1 Tax=Candidatus Hepatoplasma crinochetorum Av TaxID=1427984 RepID=W8GMQ7_9MOLU|nr:RsmD family RNA methyltransferase [Candidatus Hepatoplasma crinochetorum]AHK22316.1 Ribosomal RNA small subunit methyltransferase D [Candidatus Hepatoplasma crinochetorum Av]
MKINFGKYRSKNLIVGKNQKMRPTQAIAKKIIFNLIKIKNEDLVLDLFAGTGALGFESLSLGAKKVIWIDNNLKSYQAIKNNIFNLKLDQKNYQVFHTDFRRALKKIPYKPTIIFLDPPFISEKYYDISLKLIFENDLLSKDGIIILEKPIDYKIDNLKLYNIFINKKLGVNKEIIFIKK